MTNTEPLTAAPPPPARLDADARAWWRRLASWLVARRIIARCDLLTLAVLAGHHVAVAREIRKAGGVVDLEAMRGLQECRAKFFLPAISADDLLAGPTGRAELELLDPEADQ